ncbi:MAG: TIGR00266 family protein [Bacteroides sp.]|nr:TIGR00266 family protein [Bacteroides sp.]MCM1549858.1 TIGR00266 family protein [Clostridium sp.]
MKYQVWGDMMPAVTIGLEAGESIYTQSGGMSWMTDQMEMTTNMQGGLMKGIGRMFSGESLFMATYTANAPNQEITLASAVPGEIKMFEIRPGYEIIAQKGAFLCATPGVELKAFVTNVKGGLFGGEGFVLQHYTGQGLVFCELDGAIREIELQPGQKMVIDTGNVAAWESTVAYSSQMVKGFKNILFGGEGLFLTTLTGPGKIWLQTISISELAGRLIPYMPAARS